MEHESTNWECPLLASDKWRGGGPFGQPAVLRRGGGWGGRGSGPFSAPDPQTVSGGARKSRIDASLCLIRGKSRAQRGPEGPVSSPDTRGTHVPDMSRAISIVFTPQTPLRGLLPELRTPGQATWGPCIRGAGGLGARVQEGLLSLLVEGKGPHSGSRAVSHPPRQKS